MRSRLLALMLGAVLLAGCGSDSKKEKDADGDTAAATATATASATATEAATEAAQSGGCQSADKPAPKKGKADKPSESLDAGKTYTATVKTSCGEFTIVLDVKNAPKTAASFASLAKQGFYDQTSFHRIVPGFVIQGGDPLGTGLGGPGYKVVEAPPKSLKYVPGVVAMAKTATEKAGTSGSQFFVMTGDSVPLPPDYALVGKIKDGMDVVQTIGTQPTGPDEAPVDPVVIDSITIDEQ